MDKKIECKIIQDLLPNYVDKVAMKETTEYIENHIEECKECKKILQQMQGEVKISLNQEKEIDYLKKIRKKEKKLKETIIVLTIIIIYLLVDKMFL